LEDLEHQVPHLGAQHRLEEAKVSFVLLEMNDIDNDDDDDDSCHGM
jgi:hypothetical protein